jgi:hypothetical protein
MLGINRAWGAIASYVPASNDIAVNSGVIVLCILMFLLSVVVVIMATMIFAPHKGTKRH